MTKLTGDEFGEIYLSGERIFEEYDLSGISIMDMRIFSTSFRRCVFNSTQFVPTGLYAVQFDDCIFDETLFTQGEIYTCTFYGCTVKNVTMENLQIEKSYFDKVFFKDSYLIKCGLDKVDFDQRCKFDNLQLVDLYHKVGGNLELEIVNTSLYSIPTYEDTF